jgi:hypothetical protein
VAKVGRLGGDQIRVAIPATAAIATDLAAKICIVYWFR